MGIDLKNRGQTTFFWEKARYLTITVQNWNFTIEQRSIMSAPSMCILFPQLTVLQSLTMCFAKSYILWPWKNNQNLTDHIIFHPPWHRFQRTISGPTGPLEPWPARALWKDQVELSVRQTSTIFAPNLNFWDPNRIPKRSAILFGIPERFFQVGLEAHGTSSSQVAWTWVILSYCSCKPTWLSWGPHIVPLFQIFVGRLIDCSLTLRFRYPK